MKIWVAILFTALSIAQLEAVPAHAKSVTNEDIRDAILSVVHMLRSIEDKLERHEFRERALGDNLKKNFMNLDKRIKLDPVKGTISRLDERLATVETILINKDERERVQLQKTFDTVEDIQKNLPIIMEKLNNDLVDKVPKTSENSTDNLEKIIDKLDNVSQSTKRIEENLQKIQKENDEFKKESMKASDSFDRVKKQLSSSEMLLQKYEDVLNQFSDKIHTEVVPIDYTEQKDWQTSFDKALIEQKTNIDKISSNVNTLIEKVNELPNQSDLEQIGNITLDTLQELKYEATRQTDKSTIILEAKIKDLIDDHDKKHEELIKSVNDITELTEGMSENVGNSYEQLKNDLSSISKVEQVMMQTADGVIDTKRRVEYGVHQILLEVGKLVKEHGEIINKSLNDRFDTFELSVLDGESGALANLTSKISQEIDQVWRQIGIMHQQMSASTDTLDKLQNQTDSYVNGSLNIMDSMKGKVGQITGRMSEVDENLNYLMGRLSLVTQEFNLIKTGLGKALDEIRGSFMEVQDKIKDAGPGPHNIASTELEEGNNIK